MSSKQVLLLTVRSLTALPKVHSSRNSCDLVKALNLLKNLSTATERSEFHNPNVYNIDDSPQYGQNPTESQSCKDSRHTLNRQGSNATGGFPQGPISDHGWNPVAQNGNHAGVYGQSYGGSQQNSDQNSSDGYREDICGYQNNFQGQNGTISGYNVQNSWNSNQNPNRFYTERQSFKDFQPNTNSQGINPNGHIPQGSVSDYWWNPVGQNVNHGGVYGQSYGAFQQNWYQNSSEGYRESTSTFNGYNVQNNGDMKQNPGGVYMESSSGFEQGSNHFDRNHVGAHVEVAKNSSVEEFDGLVKEGKVKEAVEVLGSLEKQRVPVDLSLIFQLMEACGEAKALEEAKGVHEHISRSPFPVKVSTYNRILKMYSKCGSMNDAFDVFNNMRERNLTTWDTMIAWLAKNGLGEDAIDLFSQFKQAGLKPDGQIFIGVFSACSVLGDIHEGLLHFKSMSEDYGIIPSMKHYVSIVDMLGSTGYLDEALEFIEKMPMEPSVDVWETLMNLSRTHGNFELGDRCAEMIEQLDPSCLNEKSKAGLIPVDESELLREKEKKKLSSQNLLEIRSRVHEYRAGDTSHPETDKIYAQIRGLKAQMKEAGYIPETRFVLHDIDQEGKEEALLAHSERLAVSHGLLSSPARAPIRIIKNLRVCGDCHSALKIISKIVGRELIIRDAKRFHHFKDGLCSCRDYW